MWDFPEGSTCRSQKSYSQLPLPQTRPKGKTIELLETLPVPDGLEILIEIPNNLLIERDEKWEQLQAVMGAWKDDNEIAGIFNEIDRERHADLGQQTLFFVCWR